MACNVMTRTALGVTTLSRPAAVCSHKVVIPRHRTIMHFRENEKESISAKANTATDQDLESPSSIPRAGSVNVSPTIAERRADLGKDASLGQVQAFDGPAPETINGRLCMLAVPLCLWWEARYGQDIAQQAGDHPWFILATFLVISLASYVPIVRGYTRKEPYANNFLGLNWTPQAENWNGRLAMLGFAGILLTEFYTHMPTWQFWAQRLPFH